MNIKRQQSPMDLRGDEVLEPYQPPRMLTRQAKIDQGTIYIQPPLSEQQAIQSTKAERRTWLSRLSSGSKTQQDLRSKLTKRIARLSSLDSTRSSSSIEDSSAHNQRRQAHTTMPLISITNNDNPPTANDQEQQQQQQLAADPAGLDSSMQYQQVSQALPPQQQQQQHQQEFRSPEKPARQISSASQRRADYYRDYYGRSSRSSNKSQKGGGGGGARGQSAGRSGSANRYATRNDEDDDDDDAFEDAPLPMPYSSSSMARTVVVRQQTERGVSYPSGTFSSRLEELLDDRQGMNSSEQQFTKAEKQANRASIDGSIISNEFRIEPKAMPGGASGPTGSNSKLAGLSANKKDKRRGKSPTSMYKTRRQSRRGFLGLASRLKLTKKHESIAKLQLSILNSGFVSLKTLDRDLQSFLPRERSTIRDFQERVKLMRKFEVLSTIEYRFASKYETYVCKHAQTETNQPKNNYKKCIPYDYNRIVLKTLPSVPDSDYINASHVDSCLKPNAYIAAQGPNEFTIEDFWRMIWEQKTFVIVMLTKVFDFIRVMCNQYWPVELNKPERYGNIEVTLLYEEPLADFVIRTIKIAKIRNNGTQNGAGDNTPDIQPGDPSKGPNLLGDDGARRASESADFLGENYNSDDTSASGAFEDEDDVIELNGDFETPMSRQSLSVRAPRFVVSPTASRRSASRERSLPPQEMRAREQQRMRRTNSQGHLEQPNRAAPDDPEPRPSSAISGRTGRVGGGGGGGNDELTFPLPPSPGRKSIVGQANNEFLHPLFNVHHQLGASSTSLNSEPPATPLTPRTPSSAGIDRSSATRKAVKKKRRERVKNQRPRRTQFMVPSESQLLDDDDDDDNDNNGDAELGLNGQALVDDPSLLNGTPASNADQMASKPNKANERIIYQFHYNSWASHTCPFISSLLHFRRRVRICMDEMSKSGKTGPTVVHCNDGCGRTGAYLCIDANLELAEEDNVIDIYNYTRKMRQSRKYLIENLEQYKFVYDTIEEAIYCGRTWFPVSELHKRLKHKSQRNPITRKNEYLLEYEKICRMTTKFSIGDCAGGHRVENREKNRDVSTVPPDNFRPYLTSFQTNDSTDYINAVFVDGYTRSKEYIVTEWPLHKTISDFWSLIYDHDCNSVILLANPGESSTYPSFLPSEKELRRKFGPVFSAEMVSYTHYQNIKSWIYTINKKIVSLTEVIAGVKSEAKTTQVFQITCWPQGHRVPTSTNALVELMNMVERWRQRTTYGPVCVVSLNGKSRAGVYCAANVAIEQVVQHSEVDVFNAVKTVRRHRPQLIENMTEYKYCYDLILHYVLHYVNNQSTANN